MITCAGISLGIVGLGFGWWMWKQKQQTTKPNPEEALLAALQEATGKAIDNRDLKDTVLMLYKGHSYAEVARYLKGNVNTIKSAANRWLQATQYATMHAFIEDFRAKHTTSEKKSQK